MNRIAVIGGGYAGTAFAIHLSRAASSPREIVVVEPRERVGGGLAYSSTDPDHRLNAADVIHLLYPDDDLHFRRWLESTGRLAADPEAWYADERLYPRRGDFGAYLTDQFAAHAKSNPSGSTLVHRRTAAADIELRDGVFFIDLADGASIEADRCVIALGREMAAAPLPGLTRQRADGRLIDEPLAPGALSVLDRDAEILIVGTGLTAADVTVSLLRRGHRGPIACLSRRGLRPHTQSPASASCPLWERMAVQPPPFVAKYGLPETARTLMRIVCEDARDRQARGEAWHGAIDDVRDAAGEIWRTLTTEQKRCFLRHVRPYYDSHRFRIPPQTLDILRSAEQRGQLTFHAGRVVGAELGADGLKVSIRPRGESAARAGNYDAIVSCAGFSSRIEAWRNPFVRSCLRRGLARPSDLGRSLDAAADGRVISAGGAPDAELYALGSTVLDRFGETPAAIFILRQIFRILPRFVSQRPAR